MEKITSEQTVNLEENFAGLDRVIEKLEEENVTLEEAFMAYSEGIRLLKECSAQIDTVEKKVLKLNAEGGLEEL